MPQFNVEYDPVFVAMTNSIKASIIAARTALPNKMDQLTSHVLTELGLSIKQQSVISYMLNEDVDLDELINYIVTNKTQSNRPKKVLYHISKDKLKVIFQTLIKEKLIKANNTWQIITYWLEKNCEGWTGGKNSQFKRLKDVLEGVAVLPKRAFKTHNPDDLDEVLNNPEGKMGRFHNSAIMRLKQLCEESRNNTKTA